MTAKRPPALDRIDVRILAARQRDGRSTIQKLAQTVGLSPRASLERVRRLEAAGIIAGYHAAVELGRLARPVNVFAEINLEKQANRGRFEKRLAAIDAVVECWEVSGTVDYIARFVCADLAEYEELTSAPSTTTGSAPPHRQPRGTAPDPPFYRLSGEAARAQSGETLTNRRFGRARHAPPPNPPWHAITSAAQVAGAA
jgi:Lrp/AsnC family transcriptional regulator of ectoine degradation